jgi:hypothetical protein
MTTFSRRSASTVCKRSICLRASNITSASSCRIMNCRASQISGRWPAGFRRGFRRRLATGG